MRSPAEGFRVGHWTDSSVPTGCTVILPPPGNVSSCDVRGLAPGSRELAALAPAMPRSEVHAVMLAGGSAFGLAAADGAMRWCAERGIGFRAGPVVVPIVPAAVVFDLAAAPGMRKPDADAGYAACEAASPGAVERGRVGAGAGASVGKWAGLDHRSPGGLGLAVAEHDGVTVAALAVVNAFGDVIGEDGSIIAGTRAPDPSLRDVEAAQWSPNTVLAVVATTATIGKRESAFVASRGSDGITRAVRPAHTHYDGDVVFAVAAPGERPATRREIDLLGMLASDAVAAAIRDAVA
ncbi:MAG TPA: P1 family peptidase [Actinomycetota bacterium]